MAIREVLVSLTAALSLVAHGMSLGFPAISLQQLKAEGLSEDDASWFASVLSISQIAGCLLCGVVLDEFGRRKSLILLFVPFVIGWVIQCAVPQPLNVALLFIGRVITGVACGLSSAPATVYVGETATKEYRGMLVTWPSVGLSGGILLVYLLGWGIQDDWRLVAGITIALPVIASFLALLYLKETPSWLLSQGRVQEAEESFRWIREVSQNEAMPDEIREEFEELVYSYKRTSTQGEDPHISTISNVMYGKPTLNNVKHESRFRNLWRRIASLKNPEAWKPLVINNICFFFMQFGGIQVVAAYAVDIIQSAGVSMDAYVAAVLLGGVHFLSGMGASFAFSRYGRRILSLISALGMAITMIGLGIYLEVGEGNSDLSWLPLLLILMYIVFANAGFNLIPWGLLGELYPTRVAGLAGSISTSLANLMGFAAIKLYPGFRDLVRGDNPTTGGGFFFFGTVSCVAAVFVYLFLPETFNKSREQVSEEFRQPCRRNVFCR